MKGVQQKNSVIYFQRFVQILPQKNELGSWGKGLGLIVILILNVPSAYLPIISSCRIINIIS